MLLGATGCGDEADEPAAEQPEPAPAETAPNEESRSQFEGAVRDTFEAMRLSCREVLREPSADGHRQAKSDPQAYAERASRLYQEGEHQDAALVGCLEGLGAD